MVGKMVKEELEGHEVKTESNGFLQVGKVKSGVKLKSRLKMDPEMFIAASKAHPALLDGRKKPVLEISSHTCRFCKFWTNERSGRFAYFYCVGKVRVKCRVSAKAFCVNKEEASFEKNRENTICIDGKTVELYLVTLSGQLHVENCQYKRER